MWLRPLLRLVKRLGDVWVNSNSWCYVLTVHHPSPSTDWHTPPTTNTLTRPRQKRAVHLLIWSRPHCRCVTRVTTGTSTGEVIPFIVRPTWPPQLATTRHTWPTVQCLRVIVIIVIRFHRPAHTEGRSVLDPKLQPRFLKLTIISGVLW
jgi:hypothetical protein